MRVAIVGASGNVGTALLRALALEDRVTGVVGLARRVPPSASTPPAPYDRARWVRVDLALDGPDEPVVAALTEAFAGVDAVVLLAWALQPSHERGVQVRTNVDGARRTIAAVRRAGVGHLVVASSVGAYSAVHDDERRDEAWATDGVRGSEYSVDKVAVERLLDEAEREQPDLGIARIRPALIFQRTAGSGIERYFLGPMAPAAVLRRNLPVLPWPAGVRVQAVHADDAADAYRRVLTTGSTGAFNVAAPDVLRGPEMADVLAGGRLVEVPVGVLRAAVAAAFTARAVHVSPGWVDLATGVPLMSTDRAEAELGWVPRWSAKDALADLVAGLAEGAGTASPPMRPRSRARRSLLGGQTDRR